jgi:hypothetical protein
MQIRVAEYLGVADYSGGAAAVPSDAHDLDMVKRLVNDGYRRFINENPRWNFLAVPLTLTFGTGTVNSENWRYYLPDDFYGILLNPFTYDTDGPRITINPTDEGRIRSLRAGNDVTGQPALVAFRPINVIASATGSRWEALFWPEPSGTETVTAVYRRYPAALSSNSDVSVAGFQHDDAVLKGAIAAAELEKHDTIGAREKAYKDALGRSLELDSKATPTRRTDYGDRSEDRGRFGQRPLNYYGVSTYNGVSID